MAYATNRTLKPVVCAPDDGCNYHPKHVEQFPDINKLCNVATCWIYTYIGIYLLKMHGLINVKSSNNTSKWQMGFNYTFKGLKEQGSYSLAQNMGHKEPVVRPRFIGT
jgi:hypothetical protein